MKKENEKVYWSGFYNGMISSLSHNITLMKAQLKAHLKEFKEIQKELKK